MLAALSKSGGWGGATIADDKLGLERSDIGREILLRSIGLQHRCCSIEPPRAARTEIKMSSGLVLDQDADFGGL